MSRPVILHCSLTREDHGSVPYMLAWHHRRDDEAGFSPRFISLFERGTLWSGDCVSLAGHGWETVGALRRRFASAAQRRPADVIVYHDGWGLEWFAPLDGAARRVVFLHTERPHLDRLLRTYAPRIDGILSVSQGMVDRVRQVLPDFPAERIRTLPCFCDAPPHLARPPLAGPVRFGYAGRIVRAQKRLERLPALLAALDRRRVDYIFEVMGDGPYRAELQRALHQHPRVSFLPWRQGDDYWQTLTRWHSIVLLSDFEGFSRAVLEGMAAGAVPVHPDFSSAAAELLGPAAQEGLYPVGDMDAAADRLAALAGLSPSAFDSLSAACRSHHRYLTPAYYFSSFNDFMGKVMNAPARARPVPPPHWHDWLLLGAYTRLFPRRF